MAKKSAAAVAEQEDVVEMQRQVTVKLRGVSPYSQSRMMQTENTSKKDYDEFDEQHWRERAHSDEEGFLVVPTTSICLGLIQASKFRGDKIKGKGNKTFTDRFTCGLMAVEDVVRLEPAVKVADMRCEALMVPSNGEPAVFAKGTSKRVKRRFPVVPLGWEITLSFVVLDAAISEAVFLEHLRELGRSIGIGRWRPACRGRYGRFMVVSAKWDLVG